MPKLWASFKIPAEKISDFTTYSTRFDVLLPTTDGNCNLVSVLSVKESSCLDPITILAGDSFQRQRTYFFPLLSMFKLLSKNTDHVS